MHARVATFQSDPAKVDDAIEVVRDMVAGEAADGLEGTKMLMLVDRRSGKGLSASRCSRLRTRCAMETRH